MWLLLLPDKLLHGYRGSAARQLSLTCPQISAWHNTPPPPPRPPPSVSLTQFKVLNFIEHRVPQRFFFLSFIFDVFSWNDFLFAVKQKDHIETACLFTLTD